MALPPVVPHLLLHIADATSAHPLGSARLIIGRSPECRLQIDLAYVSARHLMIQPGPGGYSVIDLGSTNGTFLNGDQLPPHQPAALAHGDRIALDDPAHADTATLIFQDTQPLHPTWSQALTSQALTIGRSGCDLNLPHPLVSRQHARIEAGSGDHLLVDLGTPNGTFVNGRQIERQLLRDGDTLQIGGYQLIYRATRLEVFEQRGILRVEAQGISHRAGASPILHDISLAIEPCELVAVIGASGAGKSTLLRLLSGHTSPQTGRVVVERLDAQRAIRATHSQSGYVPQEDPLHPALTPQQALTYTAQLRLPPDTRQTEIAGRVDQALREVGLSDQRDIPIAMLSGGQRRRAAIAAELLADPSICFLDEPTAGLDPGLEQRTFRILRALADSGRTMVVATHAAEGVALCDLVAILAAGRLVFYGPPSDAPGFFGVQQLAQVYELLARDERAASERGHAEEWERRFRASPWHARYVAGRRQPSAPPSRAGWAQGGHPAPAHQQVGILAHRGLRLLLSDRRNLAILLAQAPVIGLLLALVARSDALVGDLAAANEAKKVLFLLGVVAIWCGIINAARTIAGEWAILQRERLAGLRLAPYLVAKLIALAPLLLIQTALLIAALTLKVHLPAAGVMLPLIAELGITTFLAGLSGIALGLAISAAARSPDRALSLVPLALIPQILFAGVIFSLGTGVTAQRALSWLTASRWAMDAYGASANIGALPLMPGMLRPLDVPAEYLTTADHLLSRWGILIGYTAISLLAAGLLIHRTRGRS
jgi:ABC transport system ATP-binding/permease protein